MLKNYLKIALRNLKKGPAYSIINITGLAIGIACCITMVLYVQDELTFDAFHKKANRIYRIVETRQSPEKDERHLPFTMGPLGPTLVAHFPEVINEVRLRDRFGTGRFTVKHGENRSYEGQYVIAEPSFFEIFDFTLLQGNPQTALNEPRSAVLTESAAKRYFGNVNPMDQTLSVERYGDFKVTGLLQDPPKNSHLDFSMLLSFATLEAIDGWKKFIDSWDSDSFITYILTDREIDVQAFDAKLADFIRKYRVENPEEPRTPTLQPLRDIHFGSAHLEFDRNSHKGKKTYVYIFSIIALFVLLIACINYMNLATARSMKRAKEVGMRKALGAHKTQLIGQFLNESILLSVLGLLFAVVLVEFILPGFNTMADKNLSLNFSSNSTLVFSLFLLALLVGVLSGSYPAFYLSRLSPYAVLNGEVKAGATASLLRRGLVVTQFALSIIMIVATVVAYNQLEYVRTKNLGFNQDQLVIVDINSGNTRSKFESIKAEMARIPAVKSVSVSSRVPGEWKNITQIEAVPEGAPESESHTMYFFAVDEDFLSTFEINLATGRNLSSAMGTDTSAILINETAARLLGWHDPLGKVLRVPAQKFNARVVGVVQDFHFQSLHETISPLVLGHWKNPFYPIDYFACRISSESIPHTISELQRVHEQFDQVTPFEYNFLDERLNDFYQRDVRVKKIFGIAAGLAIFVACLGLLGLAALTAEQRTKEIGIRKVLGASVTQTVVLLSKDFAQLVVLATLIATPVAYFALNRWLQDFAYHITLGPGTFLLAGLVALLIALVTISIQTVKAALANPVTALRYE